MKASNAPLLAARMTEEGASFGRMLKEPAAREAFTAFIKSESANMKQLIELTGMRAE